MNWEQARNFGVIEITSTGTQLRLFYNPYNFIGVTTPNPYMVIESAIWQGNNIIIKGHDQQHGKPLVYIQRSQYEAQLLSY